jgi:GDP-4-dehydro-6-deoxy-D-mannose reductase
VSPYAVARVSQEMLSKVYIHGYKLDVIMTRSFNHIGPGQKEIFVVSSFAKQLTDLAKKSAKQGQLRVGDISIVRDFLDVRDVVSAYYLLFEKGHSGEIYNVCSGQGKALSEILDSMSGKLNLKIKIEINNSLIRPADNTALIGCNEKIKSHTGWESKISLDTSIDDILSYWMKNSNQGFE